MRIFKFNAKTGKKGEFIKNADIITWTDQSVKFQVSENIIEQISCAEPSNYNQKWTIHVDAGSSKVWNSGLCDDSYLSDQWICFCMGQFGEIWEWIILPPKNLIIQKQAYCVWESQATIEELYRD